MAERYIQRHIENFEKNLGEKSIANYFGISPVQMDFHLSALNRNTFILQSGFVKNL